jgi:hypothetical protein
MAYVNATINQSGFDTFQSDTSNAITLYQRCYFGTTADTNGAKPTLLVAGATNRATVVAMQAISQSTTTVSYFGTCRFLNAQGEQFGIASGTITIGATVYAAAAGALSTSSAGGALLAGIATSAGFDGGPFTYMPSPTAA